MGSIKEYNFLEIDNLHIMYPIKDSNYQEIDNFHTMVLIPYINWYYSARREYAKNKMTIDNMRERRKHRAAIMLNASKLYNILIREYLFINNKTLPDDIIDIWPATGRGGIDTDQYYNNIKSFHNIIILEVHKLYIILREKYLRKQKKSKNKEFEPKFVKKLTDFYTEKIKWYANKTRKQFLQFNYV